MRATKSNANDMTEIPGQVAWRRLVNSREVIGALSHG
jgi:hypothetical protein